MIILAIDTASTLCAACIWDTGTGERGREVIDLGKGHAEHLIAAIDAALDRAGLAYADLGAIAVSVGPGSFTGVRIGVATARGLALALDVPAIGISTLDALALEAREAHPGREVQSLIDAGRGQVYSAHFDTEGAPVSAPAVEDFNDAVAMAAGAILTGSAASAIAKAAGIDATIVSSAATADIATYARLAAERLAHDPQPARPVPLYLRGADAKPQTAFAVARKTVP
ncbi:tRNA (adenosine(37)-N6)-threonylcarbamoyltransferase complex dimerization subunit type 1 TsaB [Mesorhizobium sp. CAU 1732]|uniref:tRNA (adenosine(37)-N6)-threonylcarbamoyltransferase complex dimerization subunit type 1 TsaB n=1 Tax=Mesorhizobium sp. CAU 1732 TaxID=3140358 RepID=UPI003260B41E